MTCDLREIPFPFSFPISISIVTVMIFRRVQHGIEHLFRSVLEAPPGQSSILSLALVVAGV